MARGTLVGRSPLTTLGLLSLAPVRGGEGWGEGAPSVEVTTANEV
jgi:hypothetical protein